MQTIKITEKFAENIAARKSPWLIICKDYAVGVYDSRAEARISKTTDKLVGKVVKYDEVNFEVVKPLVPEVKQVVPSVPVEQLFGAKEPAAPAADIYTEVKAAEKKSPKIPLTRESTIERPCKRVWHIADEMMEKAGGLQNLRRKDVLAYCVANGIAYYTARTQYQLWLTIQNGGSI